MIHTIDSEKFLELGKKHPIFDVRAPQEYIQGHIPNAHSLPLFSDEQRALIGTLYKQRGKEIAMKQALELVGPHMTTLVEIVQEITVKYNSSKTILLHCWRGGMRSASVAWLLNFFGYDVYLLDGGYKKFRAYIRALFDQPYTLHVISGKTGTGKTDLLKLLQTQELQVIDLEKLARHKGSVFGAYPQAQPTQEQFDNDLGYALNALDQTKPVWIEDESKKIGAITIPEPFFCTLQKSQRFIIDMPLEPRITYLIQEYKELGTALLVHNTQKLTKHLGGLETQRIVDALLTNDYVTACTLLITHYDKTYGHGQQKRTSPVHALPIDNHSKLADLAHELTRVY